MAEPKIPLTLKVCSDGLAMEVIPRERLNLSLENAREVLEAQGGYEVLIFTPHFIVVKNLDGVKVTFRKDGRMIVRNARAEDEVRQVALNVLRLALAADANAKRQARPLR